MFNFNQTQFTSPRILNIHICLGLVFLFFAFKVNAQEPHLTVGFACEPTIFDDEPCIQSQCDDIQRPRIATHPSRPVNAFNQSRLNLFDWRTVFYPIVSTAPGTIIRSPFYQDDNGNLTLFSNLDSKDMLPENGWEIIKYDLGGALSTSHNVNEKVQTPYVVLYNRFLSKMRVFVARGDKEYKTNYSDIIISMDNINKSSLLDLHHGYLKPLDMPFTKNANMQAGARVVNSLGQWSFAEFPMVYDPCTCEYDKNSLLISVNDVVASSINLSGTIQGTIASNNGTSVNATKEGDGISTKSVPETAKIVGQYYVKGYSIASKFIDDSKKIIDNTYGVGDTNKQLKINALNQLGIVLNTNNGLGQVLRTGLQAVPYMTAALSIYDMFTAGGVSTGPQKVEIMPMSLNAKVVLNGEIRQSSIYREITFATPGSNTALTQIENYPYYNETLGVFNLLETPKLSRSSYNAVSIGNPDWEMYSYHNSYKLASPIKYVINPASGLEVQDVQAALVLRSKSITTSHTFENMISTDMATTKHVNLLTEAPQAGLYTIGIHESVSDKMIDKDNIWIQLILNLRRKDGKGSNVVLVVTYPTTFVEGTGACKDCFQQVAQSEVRSFCTDKTSIYRVNRIAAKESPNEMAMQPTIQRFKAFPNPVDNLLHINYDSETEQTVKVWLTDVTGRMVSDIVEQKSGKGNSNLDLPTQNLPEGLHLLIFEVNGIKKVQKVVIRH